MFGDVRLCCILVCILALCITYFTNADSVTWVQNFPGNITRYRRETVNCGPDTFHCGSKECIREENQCDGKVDCQDGSDETDDCMGVICPFFRCAYGACIAKHLECNGEKNCKDNSDETSPKCRNIKPVTQPSTNTCGTGKFRCKSGQCINEEESCDGKPQCDDNSDESVEECSKITCPPFTYTCKYGGCVSKSARCNRTQECFDGSDEVGCPVTIGPVIVTPTPPVTPPITPPTAPPTQPPVVPGSCLIPNNPQYGEFSVGDKASGFYKPGSYVPQFSALKLNCKERFKIIPPQANPYSLCTNGQWSPPPGTCARSCRSIHSSISTKVECTYNRRPLDSCENPVEGTIATLSCEPLYEEPGLARNPTRICKDGSWDFHIAECLPMCGVKHPVGNINVIGGHKAKQGDYPWQVAIYTADKNHICGGSILNQRVILSAAHCFANSDGRLNPKENYLIGAGKYYRTYDDDRDEKAQHSKIDAIYIPERYKGIVTNFEADIAVVILETKLNLSIAVQPVCVDWGTNFEYQQLSENNFGIVTGWGYTVEGDTPSEELKELNVPYISFAQCYDQVPKQFRKYLTHDKVCAGYLYNGTAVCQGDSGGGLTFHHVDDKYYIRGVVSTSPASEGGSCDSNQYGTYTLVSKHIDFIRTLEVQNRS